MEAHFISETDIAKEMRYRTEEALSLGRTEKQARIEADEWRNKIEHEQKNTRRRFTEPKESGALS